MRIAVRIFFRPAAVGDIQRFFDVQFSFLSVFSHSSIVVNTISDVGILLNLRKENIFSYGMEGACFDEEHVTFVNRCLMQHRQQVVLPDPSLKLLSANFVFKAKIQKGVRRGVHDIPHLRLPVLILIFLRIGVIRMYLNRQVVPCIDQFGQDRKIGEFGAIFSQNGPSLRFQIFPQGFPRIGAVLNDAGSVRMAGQYPRLRKNLSLTGNSIFRLQSVPAPEVVLAGRFQLHQPHFSLLLSLISCDPE